MRRACVLIALVALVGCETTSAPGNTIYADGTELQQFENLVFCGDQEAFTIALGEVGRHLGKAWDEVIGVENQEQCTIKISANRAGEITGHQIEDCANPDLPKVLVAASPIPVPKSQCLFEYVNGVNFTINSAPDT